MTKTLLGALLATITLTAAGADMLVSTDWLAKHATDANVLILHIAPNRTVYDKGHITGARFVSLTDIAITRDGIANELPPVADLKKVFEAAGLTNSSHVILYSEASVLPATRAYFTLDYLGHDHKTALLNGGLEKWRTEGRTLTPDAPPTRQGSFTPKVKPELLASMSAVKQIPSDPKAVLLDVRSAADYRGEKGAHIPGAVNAFWMEHQTSREDQTLKPAETLRQKYEAMGLTPKKHVVTYCNSGMQASQSYFTLKYLGYKVALYDGSLSEWQSKGAPLEK